MWAAWAALARKNNVLWDIYYRPLPMVDHIATWEAWFQDDWERGVEEQAITEEQGWPTSPDAAYLPLTTTEETGMTWMFALVLTLLLGPLSLHVVAQTMAVSAVPLEIHSKHWIFGYPLGTPATNDLIIRDIYALSSNDTTTFADWVAYRLDSETVTGDVRTTRRWKADPWLAEDETLEPADYTRAHALLATDRGHQAPLASFKGTDAWQQTNYLSNITPQKSALNQGPWKRLEDSVRAYVRAGHVVWVLTGPLYERIWAELPNADELSTIPSGYWKIIATGERGKPASVRAVAFLFDQETPRDADFLAHIRTIDEVEARAKLDMFRELPDAVEAVLESTPGTWPLPGP